MLNILLEKVSFLFLVFLHQKSLKEFCSLDDAPIEDIEGLEQLRAIYHGKKIAMVKVASTGFGIDTQEDLKRAIEIFL